MKKIIFSILILLSLNSKAQIDTLNQIVIANAGEVIESQNYILNFTLGEFMVETFNSGQSILSQGFHQVDSLISTSIREISGFKHEIIAYPNPTQDFITLEFNFIKQRSIEIHLLNLIF